MTSRLNKAPKTRRTITVRLVYTRSELDPNPREASLGLQDKDQEVHPGEISTDGSIAFDAPLEVSGEPGVSEPAFSGRFVHGPPAARFLYLSWKRTPAAEAPWAQRIKIPLQGLTWKLVTPALKRGSPLQSNVTGRRPHDTRPIAWL